MRIGYLLVILAFHATIGASQKHDYIWLMGQTNQTTPEHAGTVIDFNITPPDIYYEFRDMYFRQANASICDTAGNLLFYTNGLYIANALDEPMENGMGLNPGPFAEQNQGYGYILTQGAIILPIYENDSLYYLLHMDRELNQQQTGTESRHFYCTLINTSANNGLGTIIFKNQIILTGLFDIGKITASRHANGHDWWVILRRYNTNEYLRFLVTKNGIIQHSSQNLGVAIPEPPASLGQAVFSPDGTKYAKINVPGFAGDPIYLSIFDFDRCTGELGNFIQFTYTDTASAGGIAISPNNRFLYVSSYKYIYQYDLHAFNIEASRITVAEWDGFTELNFFATTFYLAQLAPDGKIYINSNNSVSYLHVINNPDSLGLACDVCQHCIDLPSWNSFSLPNFPNYRLHHLEDSPCDTLRQPPVAVWHYELEGPEVAFQDSSYHDIRIWHWDFGDGNTDTLPHPVHAYAATGTYNVCLIVSNPRGADTLCQEIQVIVNGIEEAGKGIVAHLSPNPVSGAVPVNVVAEFPTSATIFVGTVSLRDALGREVLRETLQVVAGKVQQELKMGHLPAGVYLCIIELEREIVWQGKVVKQ